MYFVTLVFRLKSIPLTDVKREVALSTDENNLPKFCRRKLRIWNSAATYMKKKKWGDKVGGQEELLLRIEFQRARLKDSVGI